MGHQTKGPDPAEAQQAAYLVKPLLASLVFFALAAALGVVLRCAFVIEMPEWLNYKHLQHAHSHIALLGWLFGALYLLVVGVFSLDYQRYHRLYWLLQGSVAGMAISFPIVGYTSLSIAFTTIHILLSYVFVSRVWKEVDRKGMTGWPVKFLKASLAFLVISTLGTWALGPIIALGLKGGAWYYGAIQFYLHFQFNGWLVFAMLAIMFQMFGLCNIRFDHALMRVFLITLVVSVFLTFALAVTWSTPLPFIFGINSLGVLVQLMALFVFMQLIVSKWRILRAIFTPFSGILLSIAGVALVIKILVQTAVVIPAVAEISYTIRNFVVGFIHLLMLGSLSLFVFAVMTMVTGIKQDVMAIRIFIVGVVTTELLLFGQGLALWMGWGFMPGYYLLLASFSGLIFIGVALHTFQGIRHRA